MDFQLNKKPNLIDLNVKQSIYKLIKDTNDKKTISDRISEFLTCIYKDYFIENKLLCFIFVITIIFLCYRYFNKKNTKKNTKNKKNTEQFSSQTNHLLYSQQPSFNPLYSVNGQINRNEQVNYPPELLPINIPNRNGLTYTNNLYNNEPIPFNNSENNTDNYNYNNAYENKGLSYYTGTLNTYDNSTNSNMINSLGYPTNFNITTGDFVNKMTDANVKNVTDYQNILDDMQGKLENAVKGGQNYNTEYNVSPPYSDM